MNPRRLVRAVGPPMLFLVYALLSNSASAVHIGGQPFKAHRFALGSADVAPANPVAAESIAHAPATVVPAESDPVASVEQSAPRSRLASDAAYLPLSGAVPIRFAASRGWPPPLSLPTEAKREAPPAVAPSIQSLAASPLPQGPAHVAWSASEATATEVAPGQPVGVPETVGAPTEGKALLTADLVLGYMGDFLNHPQGAHVRFKPAMPAGSQTAQHVTAQMP